MAGGIIGGIVGQQASAGDTANAQNYTTNAANNYANLDLGPDAGAAYNFTNEQSAGSLTPQQLQNINEAASPVSQIQSDPSLLAAQMSALNQLQSAGQTGMTPATQAAAQQLLSQVNTNTQGQLGAIGQQYAAMGQAGSGSQLAQELAAAQGGANTANSNAVNLAGQASQNALSAIGQAGALGGNISTNQFNQAATKAQAQQAVNQFNTQNQLANQSANVAANNAAQSANLQNAQSIGNFNANLANQNQILQRQGQQEMFQRRLSQAQGEAGADQNAANLYNTQGQAIANADENIGAGVDKGATSIASAFTGS